jgi:hypothetical protein
VSDDVPTYRVYVDSRAVDVPLSATVLDAVESADPLLAAAVRSGSKGVTDSRGLPIAPDAPLHGGAILRVVALRQRES